MFCRVKMFGGVFVLGRIAAAHMTAFPAEPQVNPAVAHLQTFFAAFAMRLNFLDMAGVRADRAHASSFAASCKSSTCE
jgi:hypothetical protein